jgi:hypothetical protein
MTTPNKLRILLAFAILLAAWHVAMAQEFQISLEQLGWHYDGGKAEPLLYNALAFAMDRSLWVLYPDESTPHLVPHGSQAQHSAKAAHISSDGHLLQTCQLVIPGWFRVQMFVGAAGDPIVQSNSTFETFGSNCTIKRQMTLAGIHPLRTYRSTDGDKLFVIASEGELIELSTVSLDTLRVRPLPAGIRDGEYTMGQAAAAYASSTRIVKGCEVADIVRQNLKTGVTVPWTEAHCSDVVAFDDQQLLMKARNTHTETMSIVDDRGQLQSRFTSPRGCFIDTPTFYLKLGTASVTKRAIEQVFCNHQSTVYVDVIDLETGQLVYQVPIEKPSPVLSAALTSDGTRLAIYSGTRVTVYSMH